MSNINDLQRAARSYATGAGTAKATVAVRFMSLTVTAATDAVAVVNIYDNTAASGDLPIIVRVATSDTKHFDFGPDGINFDTGISISQSGSPTHIVSTWVVR